MFINVTACLETAFPTTDLDKFVTDDIMDPIAKAKMVALQGIKRVLTDPMVVPPGINRYVFFCLEYFKPQFVRHNVIKELMNRP